MTWNHRVVRRVYRETNEVAYAIHEVFYDEIGNREGMTENAIAAITIMDLDDGENEGGSIEELRRTLQRMLEALDKPVLDYDDDTTI